MMKKTVLYETHLALGAKMTAFAGFEMPVYYDSIRKEHLAVRQNAGLFDVSHMGEIIIKGQNAQSFVQRLTPNNVEKLTTGKAQYSLLLNEQGGVLDDILVYGIRVPEEYMLVVNASNIEKVKTWMLSQQPQDVHIEDKSEETCLFALQGKKALDILQKLCQAPLKNLPPFSFITSNLAHAQNVLISTTGYTGEPGVELYLHISQAQALWNDLMKAGKEKGLVPAGLGCRDTLRLEMGYPLYGQELSEDINPKEAALSWVLKSEQDYIGKKALAELSIQRKRVGFILKDKGVVRARQMVCDETQQQLGFVSSASFSPSLEKIIGMAYVSKSYLETHQQFWIENRGAYLLAEITKFPFI